MPRFRLDGTVQRFGTTVVGGSPLRLFRLSERGANVLDAVATGADVPTSPLTESLQAAGAIHPIAEPGAGPSPADVTIVVPALGAPGAVPPGATVVDDGSDPPIPGAAIRLGTNRGPAAARNAGLATVTTPFVAFVDADVHVPDGWLDALVPHFADARVALVAPRVRSREEVSTLGRFEREHSPLDLGDEPARVRAGSRVGYVPAAAIVCRTEAIREIGGFDEGLRFGEDVDLVWRLDEAGWRCRYEPSAVVEHDPRPDWRAWIRQRVGYGSSAAPLARRHPGALAPVRMSGWSAAAWTLGVVGRPLAGGAVGVGTAAALVRKLPDLPARAAFDLAARGNLQAGEQLAAAVRRAWWPIVLVAAFRYRWARRILVTSLVAARTPIRVADDVAYSLGVWQGMLTERTVAPIVPELTSWPGRAAQSSHEPLPSPG